MPSTFLQGHSRMCSHNDEIAECKIFHPYAEYDCIWNLEFFDFFFFFLHLSCLIKHWDYLFELPFEKSHLFLFYAIATHSGPLLVASPWSHLDGLPASAPSWLDSFLAPLSDGPFFMPLSCLKTSLTSEWNPRWNINTLPGSQSPIFPLPPYLIHSPFCLLAILFLASWLLLIIFTPFKILFAFTSFVQILLSLVRPNSSLIYSMK